MEDEIKVVEGNDYWKTYYFKNSEICKVRNKKWREDNADKIRETYKKYWETRGTDIKAKRKEKTECQSCNCMVTRESLTRHKNSKKHLENISKLNSSENV
jgi:hypothetical protein